MNRLRPLLIFLIVLGFLLFGSSFPNFAQSQKQTSGAQSDNLVITIRPYLLAISVADIDEAVDWYREKLGFAVKDRKDFPQLNMRVAFLELNGFQLELVEDKKSVSSQAIQKHFPEVTDQTKFQTYVKFAFIVDDIEALAKQLKSKQVTFQMDITKSNRIAGSKFFIIKDNSGNWIQFFQNAR